MGGAGLQACARSFLITNRLLITKKNSFVLSSRGGRQSDEGSAFLSHFPNPAFARYHFNSNDDRFPVGGSHVHSRKPLCYAP